MTPVNLVAIKGDQAKIDTLRIGYLRRKIDAPFGPTSIETVRGMG